jgi:hypothetical protein
MNETTAFKTAGVRASHETRVLVRWLIKLLALPFRFAWLLIVWLRLRNEARKAPYSS